MPRQRTRAVAGGERLATKWWFLVACLALLACTAAATLPAQTTSATLSGTIMDPAGRAVPGVEVSATNIDTGISANTKTNGDGIYVLPALPPGHYRVIVTKPGFKQIALTDVILNVQDTVSRNFSLEIGAVSETVTVTADSVNINTTDGSVSTVVDRQFAENLPMNGRSFQTLIELTPGVVVTPTNTADNGQFSINGQRAASNYWMIDGVSANIGIGANAGNGLGGALGSFSALGGTNSLVSVDAMQEFRIQTSTYAPEFGRTPGGQISIVTRSGTNLFHGSAFDYLRNGVLDSNNWFADANALPKPQERQNDFGGTLSGPIFKDRTFFFFSYEGLRLRLPQTTLTTVPDASFTPQTTNSRQNAMLALQPYLNAFPLPNPNSPEIFTPCDPASDPTCPSTGQMPTGTAAFNATYSNPASLDAYSLRIDHKLSEKLALFGRYDYSPSEISSSGGTSDSLSTVATTRITTQTATAGATWIISPTVTNDLRFNYSRTNVLSEFTLDSFGGAVPLTSLPFPGPFTSQNAFFSLDIFSLQQPGLVDGRSGQNLQRQINIVDSVSIQKSSHSLKLGVDFRRLSPFSNPAAYGQDAYFGDVPSAATGDLLEAIVISDSPTTFLFRNLGIYAQDTWRILPRLTMTYGLRWDVDFVPRSQNGPNFPAVTGFDLNDLSGLALAPTGTSPYKTRYGNFAPRFGMAYQLSQNQSWQTVLRGGFGVFYDLASSEAGNNTAIGYPFAALAFSFGTFPLSTVATTPPPIAPPTASNPGSLAAFDPHLRLPYTLEWNTSLEQALGKQQTVSVSYVGSAGRRLLQTGVVLSPNPSLSEAQLVTNVGTSDYNALQTQFQRRLSHGLQVLGSYTLAHSIDTASAGSSVLQSNALVPSVNPNADRGPSDFDIRHTLSVGMTYEIPAPNINAIAKVVLRGWSTENFILARSAPPDDVGAADFSSLDGFFGDVRPDLVPGQPLYLYGANCASVMQALGNLAPGQVCPGGKGFNPAAFTNPPVDPNTGLPLRQGNLPRNFLRGFGASQWDFAIHRDFPLREPVKLQFRAEMFNVLNHPNFAQPNNGFGFGGFGLSTETLNESLADGSVGSGGFSPLYQIGGPRSIQLALKLQF
jgi:hypothetical protein